MNSFFFSVRFLVEKSTRSTLSIVSFSVMFWLWCADISIVRFDPRAVLCCGFFLALLNGTSALSNLFMAFMAMDRSSIVVCPRRCHLQITRFRVFTKIFFAFLLITILMTPNYFSFEYRFHSTRIFCEFHSPLDQDHFRLWSFACTIISGLIPAILLWTAAGVLMLNRYKLALNNRSSRNSMTMRIRRVSILIFIASTLLSSTIIATSIMNNMIIYEQLYPELNSSLSYQNKSKLLRNSFCSMTCILYSVKFYIQCIISEPCRKDFLSLIQFCRTKDESTFITRPAGNVKQKLTRDMVNFENRRPFNT